MAGLKNFQAELSLMVTLDRNGIVYSYKSPILKKYCSYRFFMVNLRNKLSDFVEEFLVSLLSRFFVVSFNTFSDLIICEQAFQKY